MLSVPSIVGSADPPKPRSGFHGSFERVPPAGYLFAAHVAVSGSGFLFWFAAAHLAGASAVGAAAALIATTLLVSTISQAGLPQAILRYWREVPDTDGFAGSSMTLLWSLTALGGLMGVFVFPLIRTAQNELSGTVTTVVVILGATGVAQSNFVWHIASAAGNPRVTLVLSLIEALLKVMFVVPLTLLLGADGIVLAWLLSVVSSGAFVTWYLLPMMTGHFLRPGIPRRSAWRQLSRFSVASHIGDLALFTPTTGVLGWLIPTLIVARYGSEVGGVFYICWAIIGGLNAIPFALSTSEVASGRHRRTLQSVAIYFSVVIIPAIGVALLARPLLRILGPEYVEHGVRLLRLLALGAVVTAATAGLSARLKITDRLGGLRLIGLATAVPTISAAAFFPTEWGVTAVAYMWAFGQLAGCFVAAMALLPQASDVSSIRGRDAGHC